MKCTPAPGRPQAARTVCGSQDTGAVTSTERSAHTGVPLSSRYSTRSRTVHRRAGLPPSCTTLTPPQSAAVRYAKGRPWPNSSCCTASWVGVSRRQDTGRSVSCRCTRAVVKGQAEVCVLYRGDNQELAA